jgi:hypothetical protein
MPNKREFSSALRFPSRCGADASENAGTETKVPAAPVEARAATSTTVCRFRGS